MGTREVEKYLEIINDYRIHIGEDRVNEAFRIAKDIKREHGEYENEKEYERIKEDYYLEVIQILQSSI